jgi:hypothetical protein
LKQITAFLVLSLLACIGTFAQSQTPIRVICGGSAYTDSKGQVWQADTGYNDGYTSTNSNPIQGTPDPTLYHYGRWNGATSNPLTYTYVVPAGIYHVNLYFAETSSAEMKTGGRIFNVRMQGQLIFQSLDIFATAGANTALVEGADIAVTNGQLQIEFQKVVENPKINAIEITQSSASAQMKMNFTYPDGTPVAGTLNYQVTSAQTSFGGSAPLTSGSAACTLFASPAALGLSGTFQVSLNLTDSSGNVLWQINLALDPSTVNLGSVQVSTLNVVVQKP